MNFLATFILTELVLAVLDDRDQHDYPVAPEGHFGPRWRHRRPFGLPEGVAPCSAAGAALPAVRATAQRAGLGPLFNATCDRMARKESHGGRFYCPADTFEYRCAPSTVSYATRRMCRLEDGLRPEGKRLISAYGVFQYNRGALWSEHSPSMMPWEMSPTEQVEIPITAYARVWRATARLNARPVDLVRAVFLWQALPSKVDDYQRAAQRSGWDTAWNTARRWLGAARAAKVDGYIADVLAGR